MERINNEYYVSFGVAKLLKELGFDWDTYNGYNKDGVFADKSRSLITWNHFSDYYSAPTIEVAQRWLREVKNIDVVVSRAMQWKQFYYTITHEENRTSKIDFMSLNEDLWWFKYEEALEAGIKKALELILKKGELKKGE